MLNERFSPEESLLLIQTMIAKTRVDISDKSHYFLLWGWSAFLAFSGQFVLKVYFNYSRHYYVWWITAVSVVVTLFFLRQDSKKERTKTYVSESMGYLWSGMGFAFFMMSLIFIKLGWQYCYPFFIALYGLGTYVSGRFLQFTPLIAGGIISLVLAPIAVWFNMDYEILF